MEAESRFGAVERINPYAVARSRPTCYPTAPIMHRHETSPHALGPGRIARFWLPLEATWLMMAAEGPFLAAVIARLPVPKENLAAFAVASALAWIVESPIIMMLSASNGLARR